MEEGLVKDILLASLLHIQKELLLPNNNQFSKNSQYRIAYHPDYYLLSPSFFFCSKTSSGVSVGVIKKYLVDMKFKTQNAKTNKLINNEILKLQNFGKILNTSGLKGASGSFVINPEFENFDSRSLYFDNKISAASSNNFDSIDEFLETLITERCYDGEEYVKIKTETELKLEKAKKDRQAKKESLYDKLKPMYELELGLSYNASEYAKQSSSYYNGKFFDTKVEQQDYFECICGSDLDPDEDRKYRVQCKDCNLYQHGMYEIISSFLDSCSSKT